MAKFDTSGLSSSEIARLRILASQNEGLTKKGNISKKYMQKILDAVNGGEAIFDMDLSDTEINFIGREFLGMEAPIGTNLNPTIVKSTIARGADVNRETEEINKALNREPIRQRYEEDYERRRNNAESLLPTIDEYGGNHGYSTQQATNEYNEHQERRRKGAAEYEQRHKEELIQADKDLYNIENGKYIPKQEALDAAAQETDLIRKQINDRPKSLIEKSNSRQLADKAFYGQDTVFHNQILDTSLRDADYLFQIDASDKLMTDVYNTVNDKNWQQSWIKQQYESGDFFKDKYDFGTKKYDKLSQKQKDLLQQDVDEQIRRFNDALETVTGDGVMHKSTVRYGPGGIFTHELESEGIKREFTPQGARRNNLEKHYLGGDRKTFNEAINNAKEKAETYEQKEALDAYRNYMNTAMEKAGKTKHGSMNSIMRKHASIKEADSAAALLEQEMKALNKGLGHGGISEVARHTGLKVAGKLAIGALTIMGLGEIFDED